MQAYEELEALRHEWLKGAIDGGLFDNYELIAYTLGEPILNIKGSGREGRIFSYGNIV